MCGSCDRRGLRDALMACHPELLLAHPAAAADRDDLARRGRPADLLGAFQRVVSTDPPAPASSTRDRAAIAPLAALPRGRMVADAAESLFCAYLSATVLVGPILNAALGWWRADPVAAVLVVPLVINEGLEALEDGDD